MSALPYVLIGILIAVGICIVMRSAADLWMNRQGKR